MQTQLLHSLSLWDVKPVMIDWSSRSRWSRPYVIQIPVRPAALTCPNDNCMNTTLCRVWIEHRKQTRLWRSASCHTRREMFCQTRVITLTSLLENDTTETEFRELTPQMQHQQFMVSINAIPPCFSCKPIRRRPSRTVVHLPNASTVSQSTCSLRPSHVRLIGLNRLRYRVLEKQDCRVLFTQSSNHRRRYHVSKNRSLWAM